MAIKASERSSETQRHFGKQSGYLNSVLVKRLARKNISEMTYFVSTEM